MRWAFTATYWANWHPVAWLSHLLDASLFGPAPGPAHLVNLLFHALASILCLIALRRLTGALRPALLAAALFAVHPLHVESVAWVTERKDLLSAVFWFLGLLAYARYAARPGAARYAAVAALFALGLMTKPMVVTFPAVLLLLDWWPLGRFGASAGRRGAGRLLLEKVPLFLLAAGASAVAVATQRTLGAVVATAKIPLGARVVNALESYAAYLGDTLWPAGLAAFYPFRLAARPWWSVAAAVALLAGLTAAALLLRRRRPALLAGWLWFLGTLLPVIGLVQVGVQARADRFVYLPLLGLFMAAAWGLAPAARRFRGGAAVAAALAAAAVLALAVAAERQARTWRSPLTLYARMVEVDPENWLGHNGYGTVLWALGRREEALGHFRAAARLNSASAEAQTNLAYALDALGQREEAIPQFRLLVRQTPRNAYAQRRLGRLLGEAGRLEESLAALREALRLAPADADAWTDIGTTYEALGRRADAEGAYREALRLRRVSPEAWERLNRLQGER